MGISSVYSGCPTHAAPDLAFGTRSIGAQLDCEVSDVKDGQLEEPPHR